MYVREGVDSLLDEYRTIHDSMPNILDECTVATKQEILGRIPELAQNGGLDDWEYVFMPRSTISSQTIICSMLSVSHSLFSDSEVRD